MRKSIITMTSISVMMLLGCGPNVEETQLNDFIDQHVEKVKPLYREVSLAYWQAATTGNDEDYQRYSDLDLEMRQIYSDSEDFKYLEEMKKSGKINDATLARELDVLYNGYLENQIEPALLKEIVQLGSEVEMKFSTFRGTIGGQKVTDNQIKEILKEETNSTRRRAAWLASKQVGPVVAEDIIKLVKLRNEAAQKLGFENYHTLSLTTGEQSREELDQIFQELAELTNEPFGQLKNELDTILAEMYGIGPSELMPWHYHDPFFQETPLVYELDLDQYYADHDVKELASRFYTGIDLPVESILAESDLFEREGKNPHAFCMDVDREGDIRILCNLENNESWMETMLHELGHAVYDKYQNPETPFLLHRPAHIFTTEAIAMFFGRLSRNALWMQSMLGLSDDQRSEIDRVSTKYAQLKQLIFARWAMVMYEFEKELYADPDQDLNRLWWQVVEKYQLVNKPTGRNAPDWAAKIHFAIAPCYYHNYLLGELLASQLHHYMVQNILDEDPDQDINYVDQKQVGQYLRKNIFEAGALYRWDEMIERATNEPLNPQYFVEEFIG